MPQYFNLNYFNSLSVPDKIEFSTCENLIEAVMPLKMKELNVFFSTVIKNVNENSYVRKNFLETFSSLVFLDKLKDRQIYSLLIDNWIKEQDIFLENQRLKELLYFYNPYSDMREEIESVYIDGLESDESEIIGECYYCLGIIYLQDALISNNFEELKLFLNKSEDSFSNSMETIENRADAIFLRKIVLILKDLLDKKWSSASELIVQTSNLLFQSSVFSIEKHNENIEYSFYVIISALQDIYISEPKEWIDFKLELDKIFINFNVITNKEITRKISPLSKLFGESLKDNVLNKYFISNLSTEIIRIEVLLRSEEKGSEKYKFLSYLKNTIENDDKKKEDILDVTRRLVQIFPEDERQILCLSKYIDGPLDVINIFEELKNKKESLLDNVIFALKKLQGDITFKRNGADENSRNRYVATMLEAGNFTVKDQTQWSSSPTGKNSGEIDILVTESDGTPKSLIEALNLDSLKKDYLIKHIDKTFKYDSTGLKENFIITYSTAVNFEELWIKYSQLILNHIYDYELLKFVEIEKNATDMRLGRAKHLRNGRETILYHILINMYERPI